MDNPNLYSHGLPFSQCLADNLLDQKDRVLKLGKASMIIVDGNSGEGKTTLAIEIADFLEGRQIKLKEQLALGGVEFTNKIREAYQNKKLCVVYDEAGDFDRRGALSRFNRFLNRIFDTYRAYKIIVVLCLPRFFVLDQPIFDKGFPRLLIHCHDRSNCDGNFSGYSLAAMQFMLFYSKKSAIRSRCYISQTPNFRGHFLNLAPARILELDKYSTGGKLDIISKASRKFEGLYTKKELCQELGIGRQALDKKLAQTGIKPALINKQGKFQPKKLYDNKAFEFLSNYGLKSEKKKRKKEE